MLPLWRVQPRWWLQVRPLPMCLKRPLPKLLWPVLRWLVQQRLVLRLWWLQVRPLPRRLEWSLPEPLWQDLRQWGRPPRVRRWRLQLWPEQRWWQR
jgi:hypothetical protein